MITEKIYNKPVILSHHPIQFETRHSWDTGKGYSPVSNGNGGIHFPVSKNPNPQPCGAGTAGRGNNNGNGKGNMGVGQCNPKVN